MTPEEIQQVRERCEKASSGPWKADITSLGDLLVTQDDSHSIRMGNMEGSCPQCHGNQEFIAAARTDVPALLAHIASLEAERDDLFRSLDNAESQLQVIRVWFEDAKTGQEKHIAEQEQLFPGTRAGEYGRGGLNVVECGLRLLGSLSSGTYPMKGGNDD